MLSLLSSISAEDYIYQYKLVIERTIAVDKEEVTAVLRQRLQGKLVVLV